LNLPPLVSFGLGGNPVRIGAMEAESAMRQLRAHPDSPSAIIAAVFSGE
jgi:hypothetical protein